MITAKGLSFLGSEEALVREMYYDSGHIATWALGVTDRSGHMVERYKDNPQTLERCVEVSVWLIRNGYMPAVDRAFAGFALNEAQTAAALSFHWNTGKIETTDWVKMVKAGDLHGAREFLETHYLNGGLLSARRHREAALFFSEEWPTELRTPILPVRKPSYTPWFGHGYLADLTSLFEEALAG